MAISHSLSFSIRFVDHFSGAPVNDELNVRIDGSFALPVKAPGGVGRRQNDGTYRFLSLPNGHHIVRWRDPFQHTHGGWANWDADPQVSLPRADPEAPIDVTLWPVANRDTPVSATGVRGKLTGPNVAGLSVRIARVGDSVDRYTLTDGAGEFLFLPPGRLAADPTGQIPMFIDVANPDSGPRVIAGWRPGAGAPVVAGAIFTLTPRRMSRILFDIV